MREVSRRMNYLSPNRDGFEASFSHDEPGRDASARVFQDRHWRWCILQGGSDDGAVHRLELRRRRRPPWDSFVVRVGSDLDIRHPPPTLEKLDFCKNLRIVVLYQMSNVLKLKASLFNLLIRTKFMCYQCQIGVYIGLANRYQKL